MYWNKINKACYKFIAKYNYACTKIYMSRDYYNNLEKEMYGNQWWCLIKQSSVLGCKIEINDKLDNPVLVGKEEDKLEVL